MSPILPFGGLAFSIYLFLREPSNFLSWSPLIRLTLAGLAGLALIHYISLSGLEHQGPGLLGSFGVFLIYAYIEVAAIAGIFIWSSFKIGASAPVSAHLALARTSLWIGGAILAISLGAYTLKSFLDNIKITPASANALAETWNRKNPSHEYLRIEAVSSSSLRLHLRVNINDGWGEGFPRNHVVTTLHLEFFNRLLANPEIVSLLDFPAGKWNVSLIEGVAHAGYLLSIKNLTHGEYDEVVHRLDRVARQPAIPWNWLREAYDRASGGENFSEECRKIAAHYIQRAELTDEFYTETDAVNQLVVLKSKGDHLSWADCDPKLLPKLRYDSFASPACRLLKLGELMNSPTNKP